MFRLLHVVTTYLTLSNYTWMLCEGSYLHFLLTMPFIEADITGLFPSHGVSKSFSRRKIS